MGRDRGLRVGRAGHTVLMDVVTEWVENYRRAWLSNDPEQIRALFTPEAEYRGRPAARAWVGHDAIIAGWLEHADAPEDWSFEWNLVAVDGETAVVRGLTRYPAGPKAGVYDNLWVLRLAEDGRAREFTDWWIERPPA